MRLLRSFLIGSALFSLTGCFQAATVVRVNPDGSGTVEECVMLSKKLLHQINEMMQGFAAGSDKKPKPLELFEPDKIKAQAEAMGDGVTYLSGEKVSTADFEGFTATFAFKDINTLKLSRKNSEPPGTLSSDEKSLSQNVLFTFTKGPQSTLTILQNGGPSVTKSAGSGNDGQAAPKQVDAEKLSAEDSEKLLAMFKGMKISLALEINGAIDRTNATYRDGQRLTILDFDMAKFVGDAGQLERLKQLNPRSINEARQILIGIPGMKVDMNDELVVVFRKL